jgi:hypothetical protein
VTIDDAHDRLAAYRIDPRTAAVTRVPRVRTVVAAGPDSLWTATDAAEPQDVGGPPAGEAGPEGVQLPQPEPPSGAVIRVERPW